MTPVCVRAKSNSGSMYYVEPSIRENFMKERWLPTYMYNCTLA